MPKGVPPLRVLVFADGSLFLKLPFPGYTYVKSRLKTWQ